MSETLRQAQGSIAGAGRLANLPIPVDKSMKYYEAYREGREVTVAEKALFVHMVSPEERTILKEDISRAQADFWLRKGEFRHAAPGSRLIAFENVFGILGVREEIARKFDPRPDSALVDGGGGSAILLPHLLDAVRGKYGKDESLAMYVCVDNSELAEKLSKETFLKQGLDQERFSFVRHDLEEGLPVNHLEQRVATSGAGELFFTSTMAANYLLEPEFDQLLKDCRQLGENLDLPVRVAIAGMNGDRLEPMVLVRHYFKEIIPRAIRAGRIKEVIQGTVSIPAMVKFGTEFKRIVPVLSKSTMVNSFRRNGLRIEDKDFDESPLWNQMFVMTASV